ncbi:MAG: coproporphyrinogen III oxidase, partial [Chloroflexota bacterium]
MSDPLSLYIHIPFCDHRCAYCDFNAYAGLAPLMRRYVDALVAEITA